MGVEAELTPAAVRRIVGKDDGRILEIGANDGTDTMGFLREFPLGEIHCFEPDPRAIAGWRSRVGDDFRAHLYEIALSDRIGAATFHQSGGNPPGAAYREIVDWDKSGSLLPVDRHQRYSPWLRFDSTVQVETTTLDLWHLSQSSVHIDFAWVDVQGAEGLVLQGGQKAIRYIDWWYCEIDPRPNYHGQATLDQIRELLPGFKLVSEHGGYNFLFRRAR